jgi:hypothetical protein
MPDPDATIHAATSSPEGPGMSRDVPIEHGDVVVVHGEHLEGAVPVGCDVGGDRLEPQSVADRVGQERLILHHRHTHAPIVECRAYRPSIGKSERPRNARSRGLSA